MESVQIIKKEFKDLIGVDYKSTTKTGEDKDIFKVTLDVSKELIHIDNYYKNIFYRSESGKLRTKCIVQVTYRMRTDELTQYDLRLYSYKNGFTMDGIHYVRLGRSGGSARVGKCLFIREDMYEELYNYASCGLDCKGNLAGFEAYISLPLSGITKTFRLNSKNILVIKDNYSKFTDNVISTSLIDNKLKTEFKENAECENNTTDGEMLADESLFNEIGIGDKGSAILRNRMTKGNAFNCKLQKFFKDNNVTLDMIKNSPYYAYTNATRVEDIKLITTPSSIKYLKFGSYEGYMRVIDEDNRWGVVRTEEPTHYLDGELTNSHYQLLNSLDMNKDEVKEFLEDTREYVSLLKNNIPTFKKHIKMNEFNVNDLMVKSSKDLMYTLLSLNEDVYLTKEFTKLQEEVIKGFKRNIKKGHIWVRGNYSSICCNIGEMLLSACGLWDGKPIMEKGTVYNKKFEFGERLMVIRSPHVSASSIYLPINKDYKILDEYFNFTNEIIVLNAIGENTLMRLAGADEDGDEVMITNNKHLINSALKHYNDRINWVNYNNVDSSTIKRDRNFKELADLDYKTSVNLIGEIINTSQIYNSLINQERAKGKDIEQYALNVAKLNTMSMLEIDKAKKEVKANMEEELRELQMDLYNIELELGYNVNILRGNVICLKKPKFFYSLKENEINKILKSRVAKWKETHVFDKKYADEYYKALNDYKKKSKQNIKNNLKEKCVHFDTTMDFVVEEIDNIFKTTKRKDRRKIKGNKDIKRLYDLTCNIKGKADYRKLNNVISLVEENRREIQALLLNGSDDNKMDAINGQKELLLDKLPKHLSEKDISVLIKNMYYAEDKCNNKLKISSSIITDLLVILYTKYNDTFMTLFKHGNSKNLYRDENGNINIYTIKYIEK